MGQEILVDSHIDDGKRLAERLAESDFPVVGAGWVKTTEDGLWYLYIASPFVAAEGPLKSYRRVHTLMRELPQPSGVHPFDVKLIRPTDPLAEGIQEIHERYPARSPIHLGGDAAGRREH